MIEPFEFVVDRASNRIKRRCAVATKRSDCRRHMAALLANATRQPRATWPFRYSALATDQSYRLTKMESGDVGCVATSAKRHAAGSVPGMTALVEVTDTRGAPKDRHGLPPSR